MSFTVRAAKTVADCRQIEELERTIWGKPVGGVGAPLLIAIIKARGIVLLAFDDDTPIGFAFGFVGLTHNGKFKIASHQAGVLPEYRGQNVGYMLKQAQREAAIEQGFDLMTWTFDPLQSLNAWFNLRKLGVVSNTYIRNIYGELNDELNKGPTDRLSVDWWLTSPRVLDRAAGIAPTFNAHAPLLNPTTTSATGLLIPADSIETPTLPTFRLEIPADILALQRADVELGLTWKMYIRAVLEEAFRLGYTVMELIRAEGRFYYLLTQDVGSTKSPYHT